MSNPLPLGYSYLASVSGAPGLNSAFVATEAALLCTQAILHQDIPADPSDPSIPHPDYYDNFVMAIGLGNPNWQLDDDDQPIVGSELGPGGGNNTPDRKPGWLYTLPEDTSFISVLREAYSWFKNYGPIPEDQELDAPHYSDWGSENITKERWVYFYIVTWHGPEGGMASGIIRGIKAMDLVVSVQGWNGTDWVFPQKWGESLPYLYKRGPNDWQAIFDFNRYMLENGQVIAGVCVAVMSAIITAATLGAGAVTIAFGAALIAGMSAVVKAGLSGNTAGVIAGVVQMGSAVLAANSDSGAMSKEIAALSKATGGSSDKVVKWVNDVATPLVALYKNVEKIRASLGTAGAYLSTAKVMGMAMPVVNEDYWKKATDPQFLGPFAFFAKNAKKFSSEQELLTYVESLPWYAQEIGGFGAAIRMSEMVQAQQLQAKKNQYMPVSVLDTMNDVAGNRFSARLPKFASNVLPPFTPEIGTGVNDSVPISTPKKVAIGVGAGFVLWKLIGLFL